MTRRNLASNEVPFIIAKSSVYPLDVCQFTRELYLD
jgi:hypothetical protein